jgi:hypothetical protein
MFDDAGRPAHRLCSWCDYVVEHLADGAACPECGNAVPEHEGVFVALPETSLAAVLVEGVVVGMVTLIFLLPFLALTVQTCLGFVGFVAIFVWWSASTTPLGTRWIRRRIHVQPDGFVIRDRWGQRRLKWGKSHVVSVSSGQNGVWLYVRSWWWRQVAIKVRTSPEDAEQIYQHLRHVVDQSGPSVVRPTVRFDRSRW